MSSEAIKTQCENLAVLARQVRVLGTLSWGGETIERFVEDFRRGRVALPEPDLVAPDLSSVRSQLDAICESVDAEDPLGAFVARTARSYERAAAMLEAAGQPSFSAISSEIYHHPRDPVVGTDLDHLTLARYLLTLTDGLRSTLSDEEERLCISAEAVCEDLRSRVEGVFPEGSLAIEVDPHLASKAAASGTRVRIRGRTCFSTADIDQLAEHEIFVHAATQQNGQAQPVLRALALGAPRTTATQEGLATFAELMTGSMDLNRLRRIALRVEAVDRALSGADFIEVFRFFVDSGQSNDESARSAMRVFRGGDVRGGIALTKDCVYLQGLVSVHTYVRDTIAQGRLELLERIFVGRLTIADVFSLEPAFSKGQIAPPVIRPSWLSDPRRVAATLAFSVAVNGFGLGPQPSGEAIL